jgi:hypothetical protein
MATRTDQKLSTTTAEFAPDRPVATVPGATEEPPSNGSSCSRGEPRAGHSGPPRLLGLRELDEWAEESTAGDLEIEALKVFDARRTADCRAGFALGTGLLFEAPGVQLTEPCLRRVFKVFKRGFAPWRLRRDRWGPASALPRFVVEAGARFESLEGVAAAPDLLELFRTLRHVPEYGAALFRIWALVELQQGREPWPGCSLRKPPKRRRGRPLNDHVDWLAEARRLVADGFSFDGLLKGRQLQDLDAFLSEASDAELAARWGMRESAVRKRRERLRRKVSQIASSISEISFQPTSPEEL